jgi:multidrug efflux system membrane fusion protein
VVTDGMDRLSDGAKIKMSGAKPNAPGATAPKASTPGTAAPGAKRSHASASGQAS